MKSRRKRSYFPPSIVLPPPKEPTTRDKIVAVLSLTVGTVMAPWNLLFHEKCCTCGKKIGRWEYFTTATVIPKTMLTQCFDCRKTGRPISGFKRALFRW